MASKKEVRRIIPQIKEKDVVKMYKAICHTKCYWESTLWEEGDIYEGPLKPPHHFSKDGVNPQIDPIAKTAGDDPRSNAEMLSILRTKYGVEPPVDEYGRPATRTTIYNLLIQHERTSAGSGGIKAKK